MDWANTMETSTPFASNLPSRQSTSLLSQLTGIAETAVDTGAEMSSQESTKRARRALCQLASGVAVLTYRDGDDAHGATVSAVTAVSRDPLLIGFCLRRGSRFARLVAATGQRVAVNVLDTRQAMLAKWFADPKRPSGLAQFDGVDCQPDDYSGAPLIKGSLAWLSCRLMTRVGAGDHYILLAEGMDGILGRGQPLLSFADQLHDTTLRNVPRRSADRDAVPSPKRSLFDRSDSERQSP
jgi:flavin reductase